ncbi:UNVERIFIED_CONTAM: hypothetical protein K2H54_032404 [Gekko kuhli]
MEEACRTLRLWEVLLLALQFSSLVRFFPPVLLTSCFPWIKSPTCSAHILLTPYTAHLCLSCSGREQLQAPFYPDINTFPYLAFLCGFSILPRASKGMGCPRV